MTRKSRIWPFFLLMLAYLYAGTATAVQEPSPAFRSTGLPLPRFVSLSADEVYARTGPGVRYPIKWVYRRSGLPVEVILEYENWRKIRDSEGEEAWVHHTLISGRRTGLIRGESQVPMYRKPKQKAQLSAYLEPEVQVRLKLCRTGWCQVEAAGYKGWVERKNIWGIYEDEIFD